MSDKDSMGQRQQARLGTVGPSSMALHGENQCPTPWRSGTIDREQGISKAGNPRLRHIMVELAWLWVRHQPDSALARRFRARVGTETGRVRRIAIVALARKLLIALWRYVNLGEVPEGAVLKSA
jgi:transposase